jgi:hypothetical protein
MVKGHFVKEFVLQGIRLVEPEFSMATVLQPLGLSFQRLYK